MKERCQSGGCFYLEDEVPVLIEEYCASMDGRVVLLLTVGDRWHLASNCTQMAVDPLTLSGGQLALILTHFMSAEVFDLIICDVFHHELSQCMGRLDWIARRYHVSVLIPLSSDLMKL